MRASRLTQTRARRLRKQLSPPEILLWTRLRARDPGKPNFRRQHPIGPYIADFFCAEARLVVEVDGGGHNDPDQIAHDERRDQYMTMLGYRILRINAADVMRDADDIADGVVRSAIGVIQGEI